MKKMSFIITVGVLLSFSFGSHLFAGEIDILVDKLAEKEILSPTEAQIILEEAKQEIARESAEANSRTLPTWVQKTKIELPLSLT